MGLFPGRAPSSTNRLLEKLKGMRTPPPLLPPAVTTIKKFVGTEACAVDDTIFLADFTTCDFQFVEVRGAGSSLHALQP